MKISFQSEELQWPGLGWEWGGGEKKEVSRRWIDVRAGASSICWCGRAGRRKRGDKSVQNSWGPGDRIVPETPNYRRNFLYKPEGLVSSTLKGTLSSPEPGGVILGTVPDLLSYCVKPPLGSKV